MTARHVAGTARSELGAVAGGLVQRETMVEKDAEKLDFMVSRFGAEAQKVFVNATEEQIDAAVRLVDAAWRSDYDKAENLTLAQASKVPARRALLQALGKTGADLEKPASYGLLVNVMTQTFADDDDHAYNYKPSKVGKVKLGTEWALELVRNDNGAIEPEDKSLDPRLVARQRQHRQDVGGQGRHGDRALRAPQPEGTRRDRGRRLHLGAARPRPQGRRGRLRPSKKDNAHFQVVNEWFKKNIPVEDREWT